MAKGKKAAPAAAAKAKPAADRTERLEEAVRYLAAAAGKTAEVEQVLEHERLEEPEEE